MSVATQTSFPDMSDARTPAMDVEIDDLRLRKRHPKSRPGPCVARATAVKERDSMKKREGVLGTQNSQCE